MKTEKEGMKEKQGEEGWRVFIFLASVLFVGFALFLLVT